uniref:Uncharacterized protein n=1 Tax=Anguilla anguilla TaxID=7936 RepID=A0A0E9R535_ANGAN
MGIPNLDDCIIGCSLKITRVDCVHTLTYCSLIKATFCTESFMYILVKLVSFHQS